jgi:hypothetical protein
VEWLAWKQTVVWPSQPIAARRARWKPIQAIVAATTTTHPTPPDRRWSGVRRTEQRPEQGEHGNPGASGLQIGERAVAGRHRAVSEQRTECVQLGVRGKRDDDHVHGGWNGSESLERAAAAIGHGGDS